MTRRKWLLVSASVVIALCALAAVLALYTTVFASGSLSYSVKPRAGGLTATVKDGRRHVHTDWIVVADPPRGRSPMVLCSGTAGGGLTICTSPYDLPSGVHSYSVYSARGWVGENLAAYQTPEHLVGQGEVTVP